MTRAAIASIQGMVESHSSINALGRASASLATSTCRKSPEPLFLAGLGAGSAIGLSVFIAILPAVPARVPASCRKTPLPTTPRSPPLVAPSPLRLSQNRPHFAFLRSSLPRRTRRRRRSRLPSMPRSPGHPATGSSCATSLSSPLARVAHSSALVAKMRTHPVALALPASHPKLRMVAI